MGIRWTGIVFHPGQHGAAYVPGEEVRAAVVLDISGSSPHQLSAVSVKVRGCAITRWETTSGTMANESSTTHSETQWFIREQVELMKDRSSLSPGRHQLPFSVQLPERLPPTLKARHGRVQFYVKVKAVSASCWRLNGRLTGEVTVLPHRDLRLQRQLAAPLVVTGNAERSLLGGCPGKYRLTLEKRGFVGGQQLRIRIEGPEALFQSLAKGDGYVKLKRVTVCTAGRNTRDTKSDLAVTRPGRRPGAWRHVTLPVPPGEVSVDDDLCHVITVSYYVKIASRHINLHLPVTMGTVPVAMATVTSAHG